MVPFLDLKAQCRAVRKEVDAAIAEVIDSAAFVLGPSVADFERGFALLAGTKHAVGVNSGTSALHLALLAAGIGAGDEVIVPAMTFIATVSAIEYTGAKPALVDVHPTSYTLDPAKVEEALTVRTRAIMPVHLYGQCADMEPILDIALRHGIQVIEDAAQAHGAEYKGQRAGSLGELACFSFYPGKNLGAFGEGGAVTTDRDDLAQKVRILRDWGQARKGCHEVRGFNYRMEGIQGAVLGVKLRHLELWTESRRRVAARYDEMLRDLEGVATPAAMKFNRHVYHIYPVLIDERDEVCRRLGAAGIATGIHYPQPVHLQPCFTNLGYRRGDFPFAERLAAQELSLPMFPELTEEQIGEVCGTLAKVL